MGVWFPSPKVRYPRTPTMKTAGYHERKAFYADFVMLSFPTFVNSARVETLAPRPLSIVAGRDRGYAEPRSIHLPRTLVDKGKRAGAKGLRRETPPDEAQSEGPGSSRGFRPRKTPRATLARSGS